MIAYIYTAFYGPKVLDPLHIWSIMELQLKVRWKATEDILQ